MAKGIKFFVVCAMVVGLVSPPTICGKEEEEGENPLLEIAQTLLQESVRNQKGSSGLALLGGIVQGFMQSDGGKQLGDMLAGNRQGGSGVAALLAGLATLSQASKSGNSGQDGKAEESGIDSSIVGTMIDLFSTLNKASTDSDHQEVAGKERSPEAKEESSVDWEAIIGFAGDLISSMNQNQGKSGGSESNSGFQTFLSFLPVLLSSLSGQHNIHASKSIPHHSHEQFLPPILENLHEYWDHFSNSEFGKSLWQNSGLSELAKTFADGNGRFEADKVFTSLENNSFRRMWVKGISRFVAQWVKHITDPKVQGRYMDTVQMVCNSFLKAQGYPKNTHVDLKRPAESISALADAVLLRQFNLKVNSGTYVGPAISYIQEILKLGQRSGFGMAKLSRQDIETRLGETLDAEIIEPILRVNRAFRYGSSRKECAQYVMCTINQPQESSKSALKPGVTKLASLGASWFLSNNLKLNFWDLYHAAVEETNCSRFGSVCSEFDAQDVKATTEYFHNEL